MKFRDLVVLCTCVLPATAGRTQNAPTQQDLETRLKSQFLMLRGMWDGGKLAFDSQGNLVGTAEKVFFSRSAVVVEQVLLSDTQLEIRGRRAGLEFSYSQPLHQPPHTPPYDIAAGMKIGAKLYSKVDIEISRDPAHPEALDAALDRAFSVGIDEKPAKEAPFYWRRLFQGYLHPNQPPLNLPGEADLFKPGKG